MTGPEHYKHAIKILADVDKQRTEGGVLTLDGAVLAAQVHATLALAAATALNDSETGMSMREWDAWKAVCATLKAADG